MKKIGIILLNYCNYDLTCECIESINRSIFHDYEIIVVDNNSPDGSGEKLAQLKNIKFLQLKDNLGFAAGNNKGIEIALSNGCEYIMLLNNDTIIEKAMIKELIQKANENTVVAPKMYYYDVKGSADTIWYAGGILKYISSDGIHIGAKKKDSEEYSYEKKITFATGCCMMIHKSIIERVGMLREEYFMYCEDTDYSIRLNKEKINILYVPTAKLWHRVSSSSGGEMSKFIVYYVVRNKIYCAVVNKLGLKSYLYIITETLYRTLKACCGKYYSNYSIAPIALWDGLIKKMGKTYMGKVK